MKGEEFEGFGFGGAEWMHLTDLKVEKEGSLVFL
jgi:hypothetical protein